MNWLAERIDRLRVLWDAGMPTQAIADDIGMTKSAVCGMARRLNLPKRRNGSAGPKRDGNGNVIARGPTYRSEVTPSRTLDERLAGLARRLEQQRFDEDAALLGAILKDHPHALKRNDRVKTSRKWLSQCRPCDVDRNASKRGIITRAAHPRHNLVSVKWDGNKRPSSFHVSFIEKVDTDIPADLPPKPIITQEPAMSVQAAPEPVVDAPASKGVTIMDLRVGVCRWPLWPMSESTGLYCGERCDPDRPYCDAHRAISVSGEPKRAFRPRSRAEIFGEAA